MPFPPGWDATVGKGPRPSPGAHQMRVFIDSTVVGTANTNFSDNAWIFAQLAGAILFDPTPVLEPGGERTQIDYPDPPMGGGAFNAGFPGDVRTEPMAWTRSLRVINDGAEDLLVSFDGVTTHDRVAPGEKRAYDERNEAGIALAASATTCHFRVIGW